MVFLAMVMHNNKSTMAKITPLLLVILVVMAIFRCDTARIARYERGLGLPYTTGRRYWASICPILPRQWQTPVIGHGIGGINFPDKMARLAKMQDRLE